MNTENTTDKRYSLDRYTISGHTVRLVSIGKEWDWKDAKSTRTLDIEVLVDNVVIGRYVGERVARRAATLWVANGCKCD